MHKIILETLRGPSGKIPSKRATYKWLKRNSQADTIVFIEKYESMGLSFQDFTTLCVTETVDIPNCIICNVNPRMFTRHDGHKLSNYCSRACSCKDIQRMQNGIKVRDAKPNAKENAKIKRNKTMLKKYGVAFNSQRPEIKHIWHSSNMIPRDSNCYQIKTGYSINM